MDRKASKSASELPHSQRIIASVQRAIDILNLFNSHYAELGNAEIARAMRLPKSTVAGLVHTLEANNLLQQNPDNRKYRLGLKLIEYGTILLNQIDLRQEARPILKSLLDWCNESVNLAVWDGENVVYVERMFGTNLLGMRSELGKREPVHSTALGKAILASLPEAEQRGFLGAIDLIARTPRTLTNLEDLIEDLRLTALRGFSIDDEENEIGGRCVAAAILGSLGRPIGAVSISVPTQRMPPDQLLAFGAKVGEAAREISRRLGFHLIS